MGAIALPKIFGIPTLSLALSLSSSLAFLDAFSSATLFFSSACASSLFCFERVLITKSTLPDLYGKFESNVWNNDEINISQRKKAEKSKTIDTSGQLDRDWETYF